MSDYNDEYCNNNNDEDGVNNNYNPNITGGPTTSSSSSSSSLPPPLPSYSLRQSSQGSGRDQPPIPPRGTRGQHHHHDELPAAAAPSREAEEDVDEYFELNEHDAAAELYFQMKAELDAQDLLEQQQQVELLEQQQRQQEEEIAARQRQDELNGSRGSGGGGCYAHASMLASTNNTTTDGSSSNNRNSSTTTGIANYDFVKDEFCSQEFQGKTQEVQGFVDVFDEEQQQEGEQSPPAPRHPSNLPRSRSREAPPALLSSDSERLAHKMETQDRVGAFPKKTRRRRQQQPQQQQSEQTPLVAQAILQDNNNNNPQNDRTTTTPATTLEGDDDNNPLEDGEEDEPEKSRWSALITDKMVDNVLDRRIDRHNEATRQRNQRKIQNCFVLICICLLLGGLITGITCGLGFCSSSKKEKEDDKEEPINNTATTTATTPAPSTGNNNIFDRGDVPATTNITIFGIPNISTAMENLDLRDQQLNGTFPLEEILQMTALRVLQLSNNDIGGTIPEALFNAQQTTTTNLETIVLSNNKFVGTIPTNLFKGGHQHLKTIDLSNNALTGEIPSPPPGGGQQQQQQQQGRWLQNNNNNNNNNNRRIPPLEHLNLAGNQLEGTISNLLGRLMALKSLKLHNNDGLTGRTPKSVCNLPHLQVLTVNTDNVECCCCGDDDAHEGGGNGGGGDGSDDEDENSSSDFGKVIPCDSSASVDDADTTSHDNNTAEDSNTMVSCGRDQQAKSCDKCPHLAVNNENNIGSGIGSSNTKNNNNNNIGRNNWCQGDCKWDREIGECIRREDEDDASEEENQSSDNNDIATTPTMTPTATPTQQEGEEEGANNNPSGAASVTLFGEPYSIDLTLLQLNSTDLSGTVIPTTIGLMTALTGLNLRRCSLGGPIPSELGLLTQLKDLWLGGNELKKKIPTQLGLLTNLRKLGLSYNELRGSIPTFGGFGSIEMLLLENNKFSKQIPSQLGLLTTLRRLKLNDNMLTGGIPSDVGLLTALTLLTLNKNRLSGSVPDSVCQLVYNFELGSVDADVEEVICPSNCCCAEGGDSCPELSSPQEPTQAPTQEPTLVSTPPQIDLGGVACSNCSEPGHFCGMDGNCHEMSCQNYYEYADPKLTGYNDGTKFECFGYSKGDVENAHGVIYGCGPIFPMTLMTPGKEVTEPFNRKCTAEREGGYLFECYEFQPSVTATDFSLFESKAESFFPDCEGGKSPMYYYIIASSNHYVGFEGLQGNPIMAGGADDDGDTLWSTNPGSVFSRELAMYSMYANVVGGPNPDANNPIIDAGSLGENNPLKNPANGTTSNSTSVNWSTNTITLFGKTFSLDSTELILTNENLGSQIPTELGLMTSLTVLRLSQNDLGGSLPSELGLLQALERLSLASCGLTGTIPSELSVLTSLRHLDLGHNLLVGTLPAGLGFLTAMTKLQLDTNKLSGELPTEISRLTDLDKLLLSQNSFSGSIPTQLSLLTALKTLDISENNFSGYLPDIFGDYNRLEELDLSTNSFSGTIPESIFAIPTVEILKLTNNSLTGPIPSSFQDPVQLRKLFIDSNFLTGTIPPVAEDRLENLETILLHLNRLTGTMPQSVCDLREVFDLEELSTDCGGPSPSVACDFPDCCTKCFDSSHWPPSRRGLR